MFCTSLWSLYFNDNDFYAFIESGLITTLTAFVLILLSRGKDNKPINLRDGFYVVTIAWLSMALFCSLPYYQSAYFNSFVDSFLVFHKLGPGANITKSFAERTVVTKDDIVGLLSRKSM